MIKSKKDKVTKNMTLGLIITKYPETAEIMTNFGLKCVGCHVATWETIEEGTKGHGINKKTMKEMLSKMNKSIKSNEEVLKI